MLGSRKIKIGKMPDQYHTIFNFLCPSSLLNLNKMENQSSQKFETSAEKIGAMLKKAQQEIEQMALQFSLGKAEASDIYEQIKMEFTSKVNEWTRLWSDLTTHWIR